MKTPTTPGAAAASEVSRPLMSARANGLRTNTAWSTSWRACARLSTKRAPTEDQVGVLDAADGGAEEGAGRGHDATLGRAAERPGG